MNISDRRLPGWVMPAGLGVLVVALVVIALSRDPVSLDPDTPEGAVQEYLLAINEERWVDAVEVIHEDTRGACVGSDLAAFAPSAFTAELSDGTGLEDAAVPEPGIDPAGETTRVEVLIRRNETGALGTGWTENLVFQLTEDDGFWWITGDPWPHFTWSCGENR